MLKSIIEHIKNLGWGSKLALAIFLFIVMFADFLANEKPLMCNIDNERYYPALIDLGVKFGLREWPAELREIRWTDHSLNKYIPALIPFSSHSIPEKFKSFQKPGSQHWLGTDKLGRDVAAGMIHGTRIAFCVGLLSVFLALIIGLFLGVMAGYFGDYTLSISVSRLIFNALLIPFAWFYGISIFDDTDGFNLWWIFARTVILIGFIFVLANGIYSFIRKNSFYHSKRIPMKLDFFISRGIEIFTSIPGLFLLLALLAVIRTPSIWNVILILGLIRWPSIARLARAEMLVIRQEEYIQSARSLGLTHWQVIKKHALPNGMNSIIVACAFGIAVAILFESSLSFLGIGLAPEDVSWGSLLGQARNNFSAWWLSVFPGMTIFGIIILFNNLGNRYQSIT